MLFREATEILGSVEGMEATASQKKTVIIRVCARYDARLHGLRENVTVLTAFLGLYMRYRLVFQKKDTAVDEFVDRFHAFVKMMPDDAPALLRLRVLLAVFSSSFAQVRAVHERLVAILEEGGSVDDGDARETVRVLRANGFYHYPYLLPQDSNLRPFG